MATIKISELTATATIDDASIFPVVKSGVTYKVTNANLKGSVLANVPGANVTGTLSNTVTGNITAVGTLGNLNVSANVIAGNVVVGGGSGGNITGANVISANSINTIALTTTGAVNLGAVGNITVTGGTSGYVLSTNGSGALSWVAQSGGGGSSYGDSNVASYLPTYTGNLTAGNLTSGGVVDLTTSSNVSLGPVGNIKITGGTSGYVLSTDGSGTLSWVAQSGGGGSYGDSNVASYLPTYTGNLTAANLTVSGVSNFSSTGYMLVPKGTTAQRPGSGVAGYVRYNTDMGVLECYNAQGAWQPAGGYKHVTVSTSTYTASSWDFCWTDTNSAAITITLPASPAKGDTIRIIDVASSFDTNNLTVDRNGQKIQGDTTDMTVTVAGAAFDLIYYNATYGWRVFSV